MHYVRRAYQRSKESFFYYFVNKKYINQMRTSGRISNIKQLFIIKKVELYEILFSTQNADSNVPIVYIAVPSNAITKHAFEFGTK